MRDVFSDAYQFHLPYFQRAYAWHTTEVGRLLSDITAAMRSETAEKGYFLGTMMIAKAPGIPHAALVDGHQRIMTLTLLFAVLRDMESNPALHALLSGFIRGEHKRLVPQEVLAVTCDRFVQATGATAIEPDVDIDDFCESERNIIENRNYLRAELSSAAYAPELRRALISYLTEHCFVVVSQVEDEDAAWNFVRTEEETRVSFTLADRAKFSLLSIVPAAEREACTLVWEDCEALVGANDLYGLLAHLRLLKRRKRTGRPVEIEIADAFKLNQPGAGLEFLNRHLKPAAEHLARLRRRRDSQISELAERMSWVDRQLWVPAALLWLDGKRDEKETELFFKRLERLVWMMKIAGFDPTRQQTRILHLLGEIDRVGGPVAKLTELDINANLRDHALRNLRSPSFDAKKYYTEVLRRICVAIGEDPGPIERTTLTVEHILPKGYTPKSPWRAAFPSRAAVSEHAHRLGNLTFLTPADNQRADTHNWPEKRTILAASQIEMSRQLAEHDSWTPERILARTEACIALLFKEWDIPLQGSAR